MSTQNWESVTWEWLEREIVDWLMIAGERQEKPRLLTGLLAQRPKVRASTARHGEKQAQESANG